MLYSSDEIKKILSKNLKKARQSDNLTHDKLSEKAEISTSFLKDIEGSVSLCSLETLINLCIALNTTPNQILRDIFIENNIKDENISKQIMSLNNYEKKAVYALVQYFNQQNS